MNSQALQLAFQHSRFVRRFFYHDAIGSTNDKAKELAAHGADEGTLVIADAQTRGRGRGDRDWYSAPGFGIYVSIVFRPGLPVQAGFGVLAAVAVGAASAIEALGPTAVVGIKWPNDILAEGRKLGGILSEVGTSGGTLEWAVAGIGLNVNHTAADFPTGLRSRAISVRQICNREVDRVQLLAAVVERSAAWYNELREHGMDKVVAEWRRRSAVLGREVRVETAGETYVGTAVGVEDDGALRVRLEGGAEEVLHAGDVQLVQFR